MRLSIRHKIFGLAVGLMAVVAVATYVSNSLARSINRQLHEVTHEYLPAYAAIARAHVRNTEQALDIKHYVLLSLEGNSASAEQREALRTQATEKGRQADVELAEARRLVESRIVGPGPFDDLVSLGRLQARFEVLAEERSAIEQHNRLVLDATGADRVEAMQLQMPLLDTAQSRLNAHFETIRIDTRKLAEQAAMLAEARQNDVILASAVGLGLIALIGLGLTAAIAQSLVRPVRRLLEGTRAVEAGLLEVDVPITTKDEIGHLTEAFNRMTGQLRLKERIKETFGKYVDPRIVAQLVEQPELARVAGDRRQMTILFCDMKGFTGLAEGLTPDGLVRLINEYLTLMSEPVKTHDGIIDKYLGDGVMAYWGPPFVAAERQGALACRAALGQITALDMFRLRLPEIMGLRRGLPAIDVRVGLATGDVVVGNIGSDLAKSYTVMGDTVNLASRLESANKIYGTRVLLNDETARIAAQHGFTLREIDSLQVLGKTEPAPIFELMGDAEAASPTAALREAYGAGLAHLRASRFRDALAAFDNALAIAPNDGPSQVLRERANELAKAPGTAPYDGVYRAARK